MLCHRTMGIRKVSSFQRLHPKVSKLPLSSSSRGGYPSVSSASKYGKLDAQLAQSAAKSYYEESAPRPLSTTSNVTKPRTTTTEPVPPRSAPHYNYESQLTHFIQRSQFNNAVQALHLMMQQRVKLNNVTLFPSILQSLKLCKKHHFHILELIEYLRFNAIELDSNVFAEILGICVAKNDEHSAKQIALLWMETMPQFPILPLIHCLSAQNTVLKPDFKYHRLGKQERIWQSVIDELAAFSPSHSTPTAPTTATTATAVSAVHAVHPLHSSISPKDFITDHYAIC